jgi:peptidoglycan/xylan/chitin deacetylase (PgdA/CDA1 family)
MPICMTFDTERDFYGHLADPKMGYKGKDFSMLEYAIPRLLKIGSEYKIPFTFFLCGEVAVGCKHLFTNLDDHVIGVHTHPFTHGDLFRGPDINSHNSDLLASYTFQEQCAMISRDLELITESLAIKPKAFRAGKFSSNRNTYAALDKIGLSIDCSQNPNFQVIGWRPFKIAGTSVWEIPTYCDFSPEVSSYLAKLMKMSSYAEAVTHNIYVAYIHPMIFGNPLVSRELLFDRFKETIENLLKWGFVFWTLEQALSQTQNYGRFYNTIGKVTSIALTPPIYLTRKIIL